MTAKKTAAAAELPETTAVAPVKAKRVRKPKSTEGNPIALAEARVATIATGEKRKRVVKALAKSADPRVLPVDALDAAVAELDVPATTPPEEAAIARLQIADFFLEPRLIVVVDEDGTLTMNPYDAAAPGNVGLRGVTFPIDILPGTFPSYRLDVHATDDLLFTLDRALNPDRAAEQDKARAIDRYDLEVTLTKANEEITDLTGKLRDSEAAHERDVASLRADLDEADRVKAHVENVAEAALAGVKAANEAHKIAEGHAEGLNAVIKELREKLSGLRNASENCRSAMTAKDGQIAKLERELAAARKRRPFLVRLVQVFAPNAGRACWLIVQHSNA